MLPSCFVIVTIVFACQATLPFANEPQETESVPVTHVPLGCFWGRGDPVLSPQYIWKGGDVVMLQAFPLLSSAMPPQLSELFHTALSVSCSRTITTVSLTLGLICVASYLRWRRRIALYPPGPPPDPILGNVRQLIKIDNQAQAFADWERVYGRLSIICRVVSPADTSSRSKATSTTSAFLTSQF